MLTYLVGYCSLHETAPQTVSAELYDLKLFDEERVKIKNHSN